MTRKTISFRNGHTNRFGLPVVSLGDYWYNGTADDDTWMEVVPLDQIRGTANPPRRTDENVAQSRLGGLGASLAEFGLVQMPVLTPDYEIIDGFRRLNRLRNQAVKAHWCLVTSRPPDPLYATTSEQVRPHTSAQKLWLYLNRRGRLTVQERGRIAAMEGMVGLGYVRKLARADLGLPNFTTGRRVARLVGKPGDPATVAQYLDWAIKHRQSNHVEQLLRKAFQDTRQRRRARKVMCDALSLDRPLVRP